MDETKIRQIIREEVQKMASEQQYDVHRTGIHLHNGTDSVQLPISSIVESIAINGKADGVFNPLTLGEQKVNNEFATGRKNAQTVYILPMNVIYGFGVGVQSAFNGGDAEPGTIVVFDNFNSVTPETSQLWVKTVNGWLGFAATATL